MIGSNLDFDDLSVESTFKDFYIVPDYQREYVWTEKNVEQLLTDIYESYSDDAEKAYYNGSIVVCPTNDKTELELVDGQQRITTFFIILCVIRHLYEEYKMGHKFLDNMIFEAKSDIYGNEEYVYRLILQYEEASGYLKNIAEAKSFPIEVDGKTNSTRRLANAANTICSFFKQNFQNQDDVALFCSYIIHKVCFVRIATTEMAEALKIFETINQRGVSLNPMDLFKNMVFRELSDRSKYGEVNQI